MNPNSPFSCFIIGEGSLPVQCATILLRGGHQIYGIITADDTVRAWAEENGIAHAIPSADLAAFLNRRSFDYLFSIVNYMMLPEQILRLAGKWTVHYHDSLLPRYAGDHSTSWALMHREKTHGVTWHVMTTVQDAGDILKQRLVPIAASETAFTLNAKCYEAALLSFAELVDDLAGGRSVARPQNMEERTYYTRNTRPPANVALSWNLCASELDALVRALDFGPYPNPLGRPKIIIGCEPLLVPALDILDTSSPAPPGTLTGVTPDYLKVSTASREILIRQLLSVEGRPVPISDAAARFGLCEGCWLPELDPETARRISEVNAAICHHEPFWVQRLATLCPAPCPSTERSAASEGGTQPGLVPMRIPQEFGNLVTAAGGSMNQGDLLLAAFGGYLARTSGLECFDIGFRDVDSESELAGLESVFALQVPLHVVIRETQSFATVLTAMRDEVALVRRHKTYARDIVARYPSLSANPNLRREQPLPVAVNRVPMLADPGLMPCTELTLIVPEVGEECLWVYDGAVLDEGSVAGMVRQFSTFLQGIATDPARAIADLPMLSEAERRQLVVEFNGTQVEYPKDRCFHELFEVQVERTPEAVAVAFDEERLTYRELNEHANQVAHHLQGLGVGPDILVGLCIERSIEMIVGLLGVLKAGGAYVPLDPSYPKERLAFMLADSQASVLLTQQCWREGFTAVAPRIICLDADREKISQERKDSPISDARPENLAYVIYTSGSTGKPKGVMVEHRSVLNLWTGLTRAIYSYLPNVALRVGLNAPLSFDASVQQLVTLLHGHTLHVLPQEVRRDGEALLAYLQRHRIDVLDCVPSQLKLLLEAGLLDGTRWAPSVVLPGGEAIDEATWQVLAQAPGTEFYNMYGPTECTVDSTTCCVRTAPARPTIGRPLANAEVYILDGQLRPVPIGVPGEVHIGGAGLARGYLNRPELTNEKFIAHPFSQEPGARLYKTGDLARYLSDGNIEFLGRIDHQMKLRGYRIELGEIEAVLEQDATVRQSVVVAREDGSGEKRLVAYVVPSEGQAPAVSGLRRHLQEKLPEHMVPSAFVLLEALPLTPNGKVDRRALPAPDRERPELEGSYEAPRTPLETVVADVWAEVLGLDQVGVHDSFFELGGHSLLATQIVSRLREAFRMEMPLLCLFAAPTVAGLAAAMLQNAGERTKIERMAQLLVSLAELSDDEVERMLNEREVSAKENHIK